jgi:hypothetical protein
MSEAHWQVLATAPFKGALATGLTLWQQGWRSRNRAGALATGLALWQQSSVPTVLGVLTQGSCCFVLAGFRVTIFVLIACGARSCASLCHQQPRILGVRNSVLSECGLQVFSTKWRWFRSAYFIPTECLHVSLSVPHTSRVLACVSACGWAPHCSLACKTYAWRNLGRSKAVAPTSHGAQPVAAEAHANKQTDKHDFVTWESRYPGNLRSFCYSQYPCSTSSGFKIGREPAKSTNSLN